MTLREQVGKQLRAARGDVKVKDIAERIGSSPQYVRTTCNGSRIQHANAGRVKKGRQTKQILEEDKMEERIAKLEQQLQLLKECILWLEDNHTSSPVWVADKGLRQQLESVGNQPPNVQAD